MAYKTIIVEAEDHVTQIKLNRPDALNALSSELLSELSQREQAGEEAGRGVPPETRHRVVEIQCVGHRTVDRRGLAGRLPDAVSDDGALRQLSRGHGPEQ